MVKKMSGFILVGLSDNRCKAEEYLKEFGYIDIVNLSNTDDMYALLCCGNISKKDAFIKRLNDDPDFEFCIF